MNSGPSEAASDLERIENDLRAASEIGDPTTRKVVTSILQRQRAYFRKLVKFEQDTARQGDGPRPRP
jgi:hypothetical protein